MSFLFKRGLSFPGADALLAERTARRGSAHRAVSGDEAMRHSAAWACLRLRADLISTSPVDVYRRVAGRAVEVPPPAVLINPGGERVPITEWLYSTQVDLDRFGNVFGLITALDGAGKPARIELFPTESVTVKAKGMEITEYRCGGRSYDPASIWHEKQFTVAGCPVGLSPIAYAARSVRSYLSAQDFVAEWFSNGASPRAHLRNSAKVLDRDQSQAVKDRFETSVANGDVFVTGNDWEYHMLGATASEAAFIETMDASMSDLCRWLGVPGDMIDVPVKGTAVTYANITQRNMQLLIINLGPSITRREVALSTLTAQPRYVKLNTDAVVLRMDPKSRAELNAILIESKQRAPSETREKDDLAPFTPEQIAEINALLPIKPTTISPVKQ